VARAPRRELEAAAVPPRRIALAPEDWFWATWRDLEPLPRPQPRPFDQAMAVEHYRIAAARRYFTNWERAGISLGVTGEEASFWLQAMLLDGRALEPEVVAVQLSAVDPAVLLEFEQLDRKLRERYYEFDARVWILLAALYPLDEVIGRFLAADGWIYTHRKWGSFDRELVSGFRKYVRPYLDAEELKAIRERVRPHVEPKVWLDADEAPQRLPVLFASVLGLHAELAPLVESWPDQKRSGSPTFSSDFLQLVFGLGSAACMQHHARRLGLWPDTPEYFRAWLAHTEYSALDWPLACILSQTTQPKMEALARLLTLIEAPEVAPLMLDIVLHSRIPQVGAAWLKANPGYASAGLTALADGDGSRAEAAREFLDSVKPPQTERELSGSASEGSALEWLQAAANLGPPEVPAWVRAAELPPITLDTGCLNLFQVKLLLTALRASTLDAPHPLLAVVKARAEPGSLDRFAWSLCLRWQVAGRPKRESWALAATGLLGGEYCVARLGPLARAYREQLIYWAASLAIECLRVNGSYAALVELWHFSRIPRYWKLLEVARGYVETLAQEHGLTPDLLEDRLIPACGLDASGSRIFDYGPRQFRLVFDSGSWPGVRGERGPLRADLPKPNVGDDLQRATKAREEWRRIRKQINDVMKEQTRRLEAAMLSGRRWTADDFATLLAGHPLMRHLVHRLVWASYSASGELLATFHVAEDGSYAGAENEPVAVESGAQVGVLHPVHLSEALCVKWQEQLMDHRILPLFPQTARPVYRPGESDASSTAVPGLRDISCSSQVVLQSLGRCGWRGMSVNQKGIGAHCREFTKEPEGAPTRAVLEYEPPIESLFDKKRHRVRDCYFLPGTGLSLPDTPERLPLGAIDPVVFSETLLDLTCLTALRE